MKFDKVKNALNETKQAKKLTKKMVAGEFGYFLTDKGFVRHKSNVYIRISDQHIIQNITFEFLPSGFTCAVAIQPLYIYDHEASTFLHLTFGNRIGRLKVVQSELWQYDENVKGIAEIKELLSKNGLPWFEQYATPEGIIDFISNGKVKAYGLWLNEFFQKQYQGFSLLYTGHIDEGIQSLQDMLGEISESAVAFMKEYRIQVIELIDKVKENPDDVTSIFYDIIRKNRIALKV